MACVGPPEGPFDYVSRVGLGDPTGEYGYAVFTQAISTLTGEPIGGVTQTCSLAGAPAPPPPAPTAEELWAATPLPQPAVQASPAGEGLVGVATWFWSNVPATPVSATVSLRGWTATVTATPTAYGWDPGDGSGRLTAAGPGTDDAPAATHPYTDQGGYTVTHTVTWSGRLTLTGYGVTLTDQALGTVTQRATTSYPVEEREAVLVG